ncbi:hypothetical protein EZV62_011624 [Acer yangbiense]|uniref:DUF4283 domain-containing protein n=1 Tax=Acer yangbiense TaxID=1000413 RepID=A0A5C7I5U3_9ROSI|nr:hypothetical protein EZV62_011624 [Acer yangbiense]
MCSSLDRRRAPTLNIRGESHRESVMEVSHCLVGKILSRKRVNREAFQTVMTKLWNTKGGLEIETVGENTFLFHFDRLEDRALVWTRGTWHFNNCLLILEKLMGPGEISKMQFKRAEFWVQNFNIPLICMNMRMARLIAEMIGEVVEIPVENRECWGKFLRVKVAIDVSKPLLKGVILNLEEFETSIGAPIKYERLPEFCYGCGRIGHSLRDSEDEDIKAKAMEGRGTEFGSWLKATPPVKLRDQKQKDTRDFRGSFESRSDDEGEYEGNQMGKVQKEIQLEGIEEVAEAEVEGEVEMSLAKDNEVIPLSQQGSMGQKKGNSKGKGTSPGRSNVRKWRRAARQASTTQGLVSLSSPINKALLAQQLARNRGGSSSKQKSPGNKNKTKTPLKKESGETKSESSSCKRKLILTPEETREGKRKKKDFGEAVLVEVKEGAMVQNLGFNSSDHRPVLLVFEEGFRGDRVDGEKGFKFEPFWLKEGECASVVKEAWNSSGEASSIDDLKRKLEICALRLKG